MYRDTLVKSFVPLPTAYWNSPQTLSKVCWSKVSSDQGDADTWMPLSRVLCPFPQPIGTNHKPCLRYVGPRCPLTKVEGTQVWGCPCQGEFDTNLVYARSVQGVLWPRWSWYLKALGCERGLGALVTDRKLAVQVIAEVAGKGGHVALERNLPYHIIQTHIILNDWPGLWELFDIRIFILAPYSRC